MSAKSPEALRTISEAADLLGVETHVLRFWESKFKQIKPMKRRGGRRYYRPEDVELLKNIRHYLYEKGFTIRGVQQLMKETDLPEASNDSRADAVAAAVSLSPAKRQKLERVKARLESMKKSLEQAAA